MALPLLAMIVYSPAFLVTPPALSARTAIVARPVISSADQQFGGRARPPLAFEGLEGEAHLGRRNMVPFENDLESNLSADECRAILRERGVDVPEGTEKAGLLALLKTSAPMLGSLPDFGALESERVDVFERVSPAVAFIQTSIVTSNRFALSPRGATEYAAGTGSGFLWDDQGHVITNYHVIAGGPQGRPSRGDDLPRRVTVKLAGMPEAVEATVVGHEADKDIAVLKIDPSVLPSSVTPLETGVSSSLKVGQTVLAIGNPFGLDYTLTAGIVSALGRDVDGAGGRPIRDCVQHDAAINPGNSGGPLLDSRGRLLGVNTMIYSPGGIGNVGIGFAVPVDTVRRIANQIIQYGQGARPSIGVSVLPDALREQYSRSLKQKLEGALIAEVVPGSPAHDLKLAPCTRQQRGILLGDLITAVNGTPVTQNEDLLCKVEEAEPGETISLTVMRACDPERVEELKLTPITRKQLIARAQ